METQYNTPTSFRLSDDAKILIEQLAQHTGMSKTSVVELAVRRLAQIEGLREPLIQAPANQAFDL